MNKTATAAERRHMSKVKQLGCLIHDGTPGNVHHLTFSTPRDNMLVINLCDECHVGEFSIHKTKRQFLAVHGGELSLLAETLRLLA